MPPLQAGGVQEAITFAEPMVGAETVATPPKVVLVDPETPTESGLVEIQVRGAPVIGNPRISVTVALTVVRVPLFTTNDVAGFPAACNEIVCTGQV